MDKRIRENQTLKAKRKQAKIFHSSMLKLWKNPSELTKGSNSKNVTHNYVCRNKLWSVNLM